MELPGHLGVALLVYAPIAAVAIRRGRSRQARLGLFGVLALASSPDVDLYIAGVPHRGITHTFLAVVVAAGVVALLACLRRPRGTGSLIAAAGFGGLVGGLGILSHLLGDVITPMGIRPLLPLSDATYTLSLVYAANQSANVVLLVSGVVVYVTAVSVAGTPAPTGADATGGRLRRRSSRLVGGTPARLANRLRWFERS